jgi:hypothetical protein
VSAHRPWKGLSSSADGAWGQHPLGAVLPAGVGAVGTHAGFCGIGALGSHAASRGVGALGTMLRADAAVDGSCTMH